MINNLKQMASSFFQILTFSLPEPFYREGSDKKVSNQVSANFFANRAFFSSAFQVMAHLFMEKQVIQR